MLMSRSATRAVGNQGFCGPRPRLFSLPGRSKPGVVCSLDCWYLCLASTPPQWLGVFHLLLHQEVLRRKRIHSVLVGDLTRDLRLVATLAARSVQAGPMACCLPHILSSAIFETRQVKLLGRASRATLKPATRKSQRLFSYRFRALSWSSSWSSEWGIGLNLALSLHVFARTGTGTCLNRSSCTGRVRNRSNGASRRADQVDKVCVRSAYRARSEHAMVAKPNAKHQRSVSAPLRTHARARNERRRTSTAKVRIAAIGEPSQLHARHVCSDVACAARYKRAGYTDRGATQRAP